MEKELRELLEKSGNNLHLEIANYLEKVGWDVDLSLYYYDDTAEKPREIDIVAYKKFPIFHLTANGVVEKSTILDYFRGILFIECKYLKQPLAFRMLQNRVEDAEQAIILGGVNNKEETLRKINYHHYRTVSAIGKLYDSKENEDIFKAVTQPVKALISVKERIEVKRGEKALYYPIVVYDGIEGIYAIGNKDFSDLNKATLEKNLIFGCKYSYKRVTSSDLRTDNFYIDFINKNAFADFLEKRIMPELEEVGRSIARQITGYFNLD